MVSPNDYEDRGAISAQTADQVLHDLRSFLIGSDERGAAEVLARYLAVDLNTALETYRISRGAFTTDGIPTGSELVEYLKEDAQILGLPAPVPVSKVFDFTWQREVNRKLRGK